MEELTDTPNMSVETKKNIPRIDAHWVIQTKSIANSAPAPIRVGNAYAPSKKNVAKIWQSFLSTRKQQIDAI